MTRDTIDRAIAKGAGTAESDNLEELVYEGYGPFGVAILCETLTDNKNRTVAEVRHGFSKFGGSLGTSGSVAYLFEKTGLITLSTESNEERIIELALESGAHDVLNNEDGSIDVLTTLENFGIVQHGLKAGGLKAIRAEVTMLASTEVDLGLNDARILLQLFEHLEDLEDVQNVYSNANISEEVAAQL